MKLVSTPLTGNAVEVVGEALCSVVEWVDACLVVDTGVTDATLDVARDVARDKLVLVYYLGGLARHAGVAELAWLAGFAAYRGGRHAQAVWWSRASIALGCFRGCGGEVKRIGFRNPAALWEAPYDVLRYALGALGDDEGAREAERDHEGARRARAGEPPLPATPPLSGTPRT